MIRVLCTGGRHFKDSDFIFDMMDALHRKHFIVEICHGKCPVGDGGADTRFGLWAVERKVGLQEFPVDASKDGPWPRAGNNRNVRMFTHFRPDAVAAAPGGNGTAHMVSYARANGVTNVWQPTYYEWPE